jgi:hypothetical protein
MSGVLLMPGPAGEIELVTCKTVTTTANEHKVTRRRSTAKLVSGTVTFTTTPARATLTRAGEIYATGTADLTRLVLHTRRAMTPGGYLLTLDRRDARRWITARDFCVVIPPEERTETWSSTASRSIDPPRRCSPTSTSWTATASGRARS